jgi:transposase
MSEVLEKITKGESYTGQACVYCGERIQAEDEVVVCPRCKSVHHADC